MEIMKMTLSDFEKIKDVLQEKYDDFWNEIVLYAELKNENSKYIVAKENDDILGFAGIWFSPDDIQITNIVVRKDKRGQGIGYKLLERIIKMCKETEFEFLRLEVNEKNIPAISLYNKFGFETVGIRKKYYNNIDNAVLMDLNLKNKKT